MKLLNKVGDINGTVLSMETNAAKQPFQHGEVHLGQSARAASCRPWMLCSAGGCSGKAHGNSTWIPQTRDPSSQKLLNIC